jgi:hypothetical protein
VQEQKAKVWIEWDVSRLHDSNSETVVLVLTKKDTEAFGSDCCN